MATNHRPDPTTRLHQFLDYLNTQPEPPNWAQAATHGVELCDPHIERTAHLVELDRLEYEIDEINAADPDPFSDVSLDDLRAQHDRHRTQLDTLADRPGRYYLNTGEIVQHDAGDSHIAGTWVDATHQRITTPAGERIHAAGVDPKADIHPTAEIAPTARIESGATIAAGARIGEHTHIGRDTTIGPHVIVQAGASIGPRTEIWHRSWIGQGATIGAGSVIGNQTVIGNGAHVEQRSEIAPHTKLGAGTSITAPPARDNYRGIQIANAIERLMSYDRE